MNQDGSLVIYGAGGFAREVAWLASQCTEAGCAARVRCFVDDTVGPDAPPVNGIPVLGLEEARARYPDAGMVVAVGDPRLRSRLAARAEAIGFRFRTLVHPRVEMSPLVELGEGSIVCAGSIITTNIVIGRHVHVNLDCTIGHDVEIGDYATLSPGVHVSGRVHIHDHAMVGTGVTIVDGKPGAPVVIGRCAVIGAAACVTKSIPPGVTAVGIPARPR